MKKIFPYLIKNPKVAAIAATMLLLIIFNVTRRPVESEKAKNYGTWLKGVEQLSKVTANDPAAAPEITITLLSNAADSSLNWKFATTKDPLNQSVNDRVFRLLELIHASDILTTSRSTSAELHLIVTEGNKQFDAYFERSDAVINVSLGNFLKLFQIYTTTATPGSVEKIS